MRKTLLFILLLVFTECVFATSDVANVTSYQEGKYIIIEYDLTKSNDITSYVGLDGSDYVKLTHVTGDVGGAVSAGHKRIVWDVLSQYEKFDYTDVKFKIEAGCNSVTDICGNTYRVVKIGEQYWMAENLRCNKYDTESEAYLDGISKISSPVIHNMNSYYIDATNKTRWHSKEYAYNLSNKKVASLGFLYNWASAVGIVNGLNRKSGYADNRQGICPNDWHIPTKYEFGQLLNFVSGTTGSIIKLKTSSGWYGDCDGDGCNGNDEYGFSALPSGHGSGNNVVNVGLYTYFWTSTPVDEVVGNSYAYLFQMNGKCVSSNKYLGYSVRCIKD